MYTLTISRMILPRWLDHRLPVSSLACCSTQFGASKKREPVVCSFVTLLFRTYVSTNNGAIWAVVREGRSAMLGGYLYRYVFWTESLPEWSSDRFCSGFSSQFGSYYSAKVRPQIDPRYALNERAVVWLKVIGSKSCLSVDFCSSGPNMSHKYGEECIPCPFTVNAGVRVVR